MTPEARSVSRRRFLGTAFAGLCVARVGAVRAAAERSRLILDGETFHAESGSPIHLMPAPPLSFVKLAA